MLLQESEIEAQLVDFVPYNREKELVKREMETKENEWEQELIEAMNASSNSLVSHLSGFLLCNTHVSTMTQNFFSLRIET